MIVSNQLHLKDFKFASDLGRAKMQISSASLGPLVLVHVPIIIELQHMLAVFFL